MTEDELYQYYDEKFKPIYADLVAVTASKPEQVAFELEATLSHLIVAKRNPHSYQTNIDKAHGHMQRASLDCAKILWVEYQKKADAFIDDPDRRKLISSETDSTLLQKYEAAMEAAKAARRSEQEYVGIDPYRSVEQYYDAANSFNEVLKLIDPDKLRSYEKLQSMFFTKERIITFILGVAASIIVQVVFNLFQNTSPSS